MSTLGEIVTLVRRELEEISPNPGNESLFYTPNIKAVIGQAYRYYSLIMIQQGEGYFESIANLPITAGNPEVLLGGLTPTYFKTSVLRKNTPTGKYPLRSSEKRFTPIDTTPGNTGPLSLYRYRFKGRTTIMLDPKPAVSEAPTDTSGLEIEYVYLPDFPGADTADSFEFDSNFSPIFEPLIVLWSVIASLEAKDGTGALSDIESFRGRLAKLEVSFLDNLVQTEDPDSVQYIGQTYGRNFYY